MKNTFLFFILLTFLSACSTKKSETAEGSSNEWKELDSFHSIMADAFHPYKDSANLAPAKSLAKSMADEAGKWSGSTLPEKVNNDEMQTKLKNLNDGSQSFLRLTSENAPDSVIGKSLTELHDLFHEIQEGWYGAGKEEHHH
jgi:hypothetical protein